MDQSDKVIMDDIDELLEIPRFLDRRIPEIQKQFEERRKIEEASERRKGIYKRRKAEREAARLKMERTSSKQPSANGGNFENVAK